MTARSWCVAVASRWGVAAPDDVPPANVTASSPQMQGPPRAAGSASSIPQGTISLDDVRRVVREELAAASAQRALPGQDAVPVADPEPTPAQTAALSRAGMVLDGAISRRQFTEADVDALRTEFHQLSPRQQAEILQRYAMAVNQGRIVPQTDRIPF